MLLVPLLRNVFIKLLFIEAEPLLLKHCAAKCLYVCQNNKWLYKLLSRQPIYIYMWFSCGPGLTTEIECFFFLRSFSVHFHSNEEYRCSDIDFTSFLRALSVSIVCLNQYTCVRARVRACATTLKLWRKFYGESHKSSKNGAGMVKRWMWRKYGEESAP